MFGRKDQIGGAEEGIGAGGINGHALAGAFDLERNFRAFASADPVALHVFDPFGPIQQVNIFQQAFSVFRNLEDPLFHGAADHRVVAAFALAIDHFFVGKDRAEGRAPVDRNFVNVSQSLLVKLHEDPLSPLVVTGIGGVDLAVPVVAESEGFDLALEGGDVLFCGFRGMSTGFDGILFRGQTESVPAHGMQHVETAHPLETAENIRGGIAFRMPHVETCSAGIREHIQHIKFLFRGEIFRMESLVFVPVVLPFLFNGCKIVTHSKAPSAFIF